MNSQNAKSLGVGKTGFRGSKMEKKVLYLTLYRIWFDCIAAGWKRKEFRVDSEYWRRRLIGKNYDEIHFTNGYGKTRPWMRFEFGSLGHDNEKGLLVIHLGRMLDCGNYDGEKED